MACAMPIVPPTHSQFFFNEIQYLYTTVGTVSSVDWGRRPMGVVESHTGRRGIRRYTSDNMRRISHGCCAKQRRAEGSAEKRKWFQVTFRFSLFPTRLRDRNTALFSVLFPSLLALSSILVERLAAPTNPNDPRDSRGRDVRNEASSLKRPFTRP